MDAHFEIVQDELGSMVLQPILYCLNKRMDFMQGV